MNHNVSQFLIGVSHSYVKRSQKSTDGDYLPLCVASCRLADEGNHKLKAINHVNQATHTIRGSRIKEQR